MTGAGAGFGEVLAIVPGLGGGEIAICARTASTIEAVAAKIQAQGYRGKRIDRQDES